MCTCSRSKSIRCELIYVVKTKHEIAKRRLQNRWDIFFGTISIRGYAKDIAFAIFHEIGPASLLLQRKKITCHVRRMSHYMSGTF